MEFDPSSQMCLCQSSLACEQQVNGSSQDNGMSYFVQDCGQWFCFQSMYADVSSYQTSQLCQYANSFNGSWYDQVAGDSQTSWTMQPDSLYAASNVYADSIPSLETVPPSPSSQSTTALSPSWDSQSSVRDISPFPTALQTPAISKSRDRTTSPAPTRIRRTTTRSKSRQPKASTKLISKRERSNRWPRHILVRAKILPNEATTEFRYFMVVLHSANIQLCASAICTKLGIESTGHKALRWASKRTCSEGTVDSAFLNGLDDMQDFVVDIVSVGNNGYVELLLEM